MSDVQPTYTRYAYRTGVYNAPVLYILYSVELSSKGLWSLNRA